LIEVPWMLEEHDALLVTLNGNALTNFLQRNYSKPWLKYLTEHSKNIEVNKNYNPTTMKYDVIFKFDLDPKKETFYRIKYNHLVYDLHLK